MKPGNFEKFPGIISELEISSFLGMKLWTYICFKENTETRWKLAYSKKEMYWFFQLKIRSALTSGVAWSRGFDEVMLQQAPSTQCPCCFRFKRSWVKHHDMYAGWERSNAVTGLFHVPTALEPGNGVGSTQTYGLETEFYSQKKREWIYLGWGGGAKEWLTLLAPREILMDNWEDPGQKSELALRSDSLGLNPGSAGCMSLEKSLCCWGPLHLPP